MWQRISSNALWLLLARVSGQGVLFLVGILIARNLGANVLGQYALITTIVAIGNITTSVGMDTHLMRIAGQTRQATRPDYSVGLWIQLLISGLYIGLLWLQAPRWTTDPWALRWFSLTLIPLAFATIYSALLRGFERMDVLLRYQLVSAAAQLIGTLSVLGFQPTLQNVLLALGIGQAIGIVYGGWLTHQLLPTLRLWQWPAKELLTRTLRSGLLLMLLMVLATLSQRLSTLVLAYAIDETAVGLLNAASRLIEGIRLLPIALFGALFPVLTQATADRQRTRQVNQLVLRLCLGLFIIALALQWLAAPIIKVIYGANWQLSAIVLQILAWELGIAVIAQRFSVALIARGVDKVVVIATGIQLLLSVPLYFWLTQRFGVIGTAWAVVLGSLINAGLLYLAWLYQQRIYSR